MTKSGLKERAIRSVFWVGSTKLLGQLFSWAVTLLLVRLLAPEDFGAMGMVIAYQSIIIIIYDLSLGEAVIQKPALSEEDSSTCFWFTIGFGFILTIVTWGIAPLVAAFFKTPRLDWMLRVSSIGILCLSAKEIHSVLLSRNLDFEKRAKAQLYAGLISLFVSLLMALSGWGVWSLVCGRLSNNFFHTLFVFNYLRWRPMRHFSRSQLMDMFRFALPLVGANFLRYLFNNSDSVIIGRALGAEVLGHYRVAMDLSRIPIEKFIAVVNQVCYPVFAKLQDDSRELRGYFLKVIRYNSLLTFPMFTGIFLVAREIVVLVLSPKWLPALPLLQIFCLLAVFQSFSGPFTVLLKSIGKVGIIFKFTLFNSIFLPLAFLVALPMGVEAIAACWLVIFPAMIGYLLLSIGKTLKMQMGAFLTAIAPATGGTVVMALAVTCARFALGITTETWCGFASLVIIGVTTYGLFLAFCQRQILTESIGLFRSAFSGG